jgi:hypothetical protein
MTLKDLTEARFQYDLAKHPNVPEHGRYRKVYSDKTANGLTLAILDFCTIQGIMCQRTGSEGRFRNGATVVDVIGRTRQMKGMWLPGHNVGQGDLQIVLKGRIYSIEVKIGRDTQSEVQKEFQSRLERAGGIYVIVKSWEDFYYRFKSWKK